MQDDRAKLIKGTVKFYWVMSRSPSKIEVTASSLSSSMARLSRSSHVGIQVFLKTDKSAANPRDTAKRSRRIADTFVLQLKQGRQF
jgi:hypothetical protein